MGHEHEHEDVIGLKLTRNQLLLVVDMVRSVPVAMKDPRFLDMVKIVEVGTKCLKVAEDTKGG